jgi:hypothetical protein
VVTIPEGMMITAGMAGVFGASSEGYTYMLLFLPGWLGMA